MKRRHMIITAITTALLFSHTALGGEAFNAENGELNYILPADNGYYMLCSGYIYFWNGDIAKQAIPLCSRPNCSHMTEDCAAHITNAAKKMYEADDGLYLLSLWPREDSNTGEKQMPIWRVEKDGSGKSIVGEIPDASSQNYTIFQNMIYYTAEDVQTDGNYQFSVWQMSLDGKNKKQIWKSDLYNGYITTLQGVGDWLYVGESGYESAVDWTDPELNIETLQADKNLFLYQPQTEEWKKNTYCNEDNEVLNIQDIYQNEIYLSSYDSEKMVRNVWKKDFNVDSKLQFVGTFPRQTYKLDDLYGYAWPSTANNKTWFDIYDYDGTLVQSVELCLHDDMDIISVDGKYIFTYWIQVQNNVSQDIIAVIERDKIASQDAKLIPLTKGMNGNSFER